MKHSSWFNSVLPIAAIFSFRMLGLFMLIPVFTVFATHLQGATPALIGLALGSYGLSQGLLQMPFGMLSDRYGRKPLLTIGLLLFASGSLIGALSHSIYMMIFARTLQGTGAIGSILIALLADLTPDEQRTKAMAVIGMTIGLSFSLAMVISPAITNHFGLSGIFYLTTGLALLGLVLLHVVIPTPKKERFHIDSEANPSLFKAVIHNRHLQRLNMGIFPTSYFNCNVLCYSHVVTGTTQTRPFDVSMAFLFAIDGFGFYFYGSFYFTGREKTANEACFRRRCINDQPNPTLPCLYQPALALPVCFNVHLFSGL